MRSVGEAAYEKWCECVSGASHIAPLRLTPWDKLRPREQSIWEAVAEAAIQAFAAGRVVQKYERSRSAVKGTR